MSTHPLPHFTIDQYLEAERISPLRHDFVDGEIFEVSATSFNHALISGDLVSSLRLQLPRDAPCRIVGTGLALFVSSHNVITYPDALVICGPVQFHDSKKDVVVDATLLVEVLSPSTAHYDGSQKFRYYRSLPSFSEYLLVAQDTIRVEHYARQADGSWNLREYVSRQDRVSLETVGCTLSLAGVYERVDL